MKNGELQRLKIQAEILRIVVKDYPHRTIENIIDNIDGRIKELSTMQ